MFDLTKINNQSYLQDYIYKNDSLDITFFQEEDKEKVRQAYNKCMFVNPTVSFSLIVQPPVQITEPVVPVVEDVIPVESVQTEDKVEVTDEPQVTPKYTSKKSKK